MSATLLIVILVLTLGAVITVPLLPQAAKRAITSRIAARRAMKALRTEVQDSLVRLAGELIALDTSVSLAAKASEQCASASAIYDRGLALMADEPRLDQLRVLREDLSVALQSMQEVRR